MYSEESDWERRMSDAGWEVLFVPGARVTHLGGASGSGDSSAVNPHFFNSLDLYVRKHHGLAGMLLLRAAMAVGCSVRALLWTASALLPRRRARSLSKARLHSQLFMRQTTHWGKS